MMRDLITKALDSSGLLSAFQTKPSFEATLVFGASEIQLIKSGTTVTISGESPEGPMSIRFCLDRNWLPLYFCLGESVSACDQDDLWERSDLAFVLGNDSAWEKHLEILGFVHAKETDGN